MSSDFIPIKRALISLSDKTNIEIIVSIIKKYNIEVTFYWWNSKIT